MEESRGSVRSVTPRSPSFFLSYFPRGAESITRGRALFRARREQTYEVPPLSSVVGATGCSAASSANQQDSPKANGRRTRVRATRRLLSRVRTRTARASSGDRDAGADPGSSRDRGSRRRGRTRRCRRRGRREVAWRRVRRTSRNVSDSRAATEPSWLPMLPLLSSSSRTPSRNRDRRIAAAAEPPLAAESSHAGGFLPRGEPRGRPISLAGTRLSDADGGVALPTPSRDTESTPPRPTAEGTAHRIGENVARRTGRERGSRETSRRSHRDACARAHARVQRESASNEPTGDASESLKTEIVPFERDPLDSAEETGEGEGGRPPPLPAPESREQSALRLRSANGNGLPRPLF